MREHTLTTRFGGGICACGGSGSEFRFLLPLVLLFGGALNGLRRLAQAEGLGKVPEMELMYVEDILLGGGVRCVRPDMCEECCAGECSVAWRRKDPSLEGHLDVSGTRLILASSAAKALKEHGIVSHQRHLGRPRGYDHAAGQYIEPRPLVWHEHEPAGALASHTRRTTYAVDILFHAIFRRHVHLDDAAHMRQVQATSSDTCAQ